jgi:hypothetical protein
MLIKGEPAEDFAQWLETSYRMVRLQIARPQQQHSSSAGC